MATAGTSVRYSGRHLAVPSQRRSTEIYVVARLACNSGDSRASTPWGCLTFPLAGVLGSPRTARPLDSRGRLDFGGLPPSICGASGGIPRTPRTFQVGLSFDWCFMEAFGAAPLPIKIVTDPLEVVARCLALDVSRHCVPEFPNGHIFSPFSLSDCRHCQHREDDSDPF